VPVRAQPPEHGEHREPHGRLVELRGVHRHHRVGRQPGRERRAEHPPQHLGGGRRGAVREGHGERPVPRPAVVVAHRPAAGAPHGVARGDGDAGHVGVARERQLLGADEREAREHRAHEAAPEHEPAAAPDGAHVAGERHEVQLGADERADERREDHVGRGGGVALVAAAGELAHHHHLGDAEGGDHREPEAGDLQRAEAEGERLDLRGGGHGRRS
jgi:hypothetical protein